MSLIKEEEHIDKFDKNNFKLPIDKILDEQFENNEEEKTSENTNHNNIDYIQAKNDIDFKKKKRQKENLEFIIIPPEKEKNFEKENQNNNLSSHIKKDLSSKELNFQINDKKNSKGAKKNKNTDHSKAIYISIFQLLSENNPIDVQIYYRVDYKKNISYKEKPKYNIPIDRIEKEIKEKKINEIKNDNVQKNMHSPNLLYRINNCLSSNQNNNYNNNYSDKNYNNNYYQNNNYNNNYYLKNKLFSLDNNRYNNFNNYNIYNSLEKILEQKRRFQQLKEFGLFSITNKQNINNYLLKSYINVNNNFNNPFIPFSNNIYCNFNNNFYNYGNQNSLLYNYIPNNNNILNVNDINQLKNKNNEKYTITLKSKTDDPNIEKISKIQVTTSYVKDNKKIQQENEAKKEKNIKNIINIEDIKTGKETRTVVRLNPIPPNYSSFDISKLIDKYLKIESGKNQRIYKALYTPLCKIIGKNLGYCFVMMAQPKYVIDFYNTFNGKIFGKKKCKKPCNVIWADKQGDDFLKITEDDPIRKPIIFKDIKNN